MMIDPERERERSVREALWIIRLAADLLGGAGLKELERRRIWKMIHDQADRLSVLELEESYAAR